ncbi:MAG: helix-turn-helix transcriptional regulator, partial [Dermatophilaceae bacterium]
MASENLSVVALGRRRAGRRAVPRRVDARPLDPWPAALLMMPVIAIADPANHYGIQLTDPGAWANWWWAPVVWGAQVLPLVWRRRHPGSALLAVTAGLLASQYLVPVHTLADIGIILGCYSVGAWATRRVRWWSAIVGVVLAFVILGAASRFFGMTVAGVLVMVAGPFTAGELTRRRRSVSTADRQFPDEKQLTAASLAEPHRAAKATVHTGALRDDRASASDGIAPLTSAASSPPLTAVPGSDALSPRERDVLALVADGLTNPEIAGRLHLSRETVKSHVAALLAK